MDTFKKVMRGVGKFLKKFRPFIIIAVIAFIVISFIKYTSNMTKKVLADKAIAEKEIATVESRDLVETITATGTVVSAKTRTLASTIVKDTKITSVNCKVGDHVEEGDILVTFSYDSINKTISQLQEDIAESKATKAVNDTSNTRTYYYSYGTESITIRDLQKDIETKQKDLNEACNDYGDQKRKLDDLKAERDRHPDGADETETITVNEYGQPTYTKKYYDQLIETQENAVASALKTQEQAQLAYDKAVVALEDEVYKGSNTLAGATETYQKNEITSNDSTKQLQRQLEDYRDKLDDYVFTAPISGTVTAVDVEENNSFAGGNLVTIQDCSTLYVSTEIDEYDIPSIKIGQKVSIKTDATRDEELEGVIDEIAEASTSTASGSAATSSSSSTSASSTYKVKVKVLTEDERLKLGMTAKLSIITDEKDGVLTVPYDAVVDKGDGEYVVYKLDEATVKMIDTDKTDMGEELPVGYPGTGVGASKISDMDKGSTIPDMEKKESGKKGPDSKSRDKEEENNIRKALSEEEKQKSLSERIKDFFDTAYNYSDDEEDIVEKNKIEIPVEVGMESDYYTQISGKDVKEGMTVLIESQVEADNPFEMMMGF